MCGLAKFKFVNGKFCRLGILCKSDKLEVDFLTALADSLALLSKLVNAVADFAELRLNIVDLILNGIALPACLFVCLFKEHNSAVGIFLFANESGFSVAERFKFITCKFIVALGTDKFFFCIAKVCVRTLNIGGGKISLLHCFFV